jgi:Glutathione S-transferase, N-terminal domain
MIRFYFHSTPNAAKVALFLEEANLAYEPIPIDTYKGEQHAPTFRAINPNGKVPAIIDTAGLGGKETRPCDRNASCPRTRSNCGRYTGLSSCRSCACASADAWEPRGCIDFTAVWCGQAAHLGRELSAAKLTEWLSSGSAPQARNHSRLPPSRTELEAQ